MPSFAYVADTTVAAASTTTIIAADLLIAIGDAKALTELVAGFPLATITAATTATVLAADLAQACGCAVTIAGEHVGRSRQVASGCRNAFLAAPASEHQQRGQEHWRDGQFEHTPLPRKIRFGSESTR